MPEKIGQFINPVTPIEKVNTGDTLSKQKDINDFLQDKKQVVDNPKNKTNVNRKPLKRGSTFETKV